jgi:hypothetical protein
MLKYILILFSIPCFSQEAAIINREDSGIVVINHINVNNKPRWYVDKVYTKKNNIWEEYRMLQVSYLIIEAKYLIQEYEQFKEEIKQKSKKNEKAYK